MLTIKEALNLPVMARTKLIAGESGLNNPIKWVTTVEIIEDITRFQEGEFLITTGYGLGEDTVYRERLLTLIRKKKLAGMALYTGFYIEEVPYSVREAAEQTGLPLIEIPTSINFSAVTKAILEQLANRQIRLLEASLSIHKEMTKLALGNDGLQQVLEKLSKLTHSSMYVFDDMYHLSAHVSRHDDVNVQENTVYLRNEAFNLKEFMSASESNQDPFLRYTWHGFPSFLTTVMNGEFTYGYLLMIHEKNYPSEMDEVILEHVSTLIGIEFVKKHAIEEAKVRLQGELLEEILQKKDLDILNAKRRGLRLGFDLSGRQAVLFVKVTESSPVVKEQSDWGKQLYYVVSKQLQKAGVQFILLPKTDSLAALVDVNGETPAEQKKRLMDISKRINEHWSFHYSSPLTIGIGRAYEDMGLLSSSGKQAEHAVMYAGLLFTKTRIVHYDDLGFYHLLIHLQESGMAIEDYYRQYLGELTAGERHRTDLILTLETYLGQNCHIQQTASLLYVHRHTLKYRLGQIEKKTGMSFQRAEDRLNLHLAVMAYKFCHASRN
ncbi:hypothetical protein CR205_07050 [Alteribacter lacisalsi]|uniref:PucR family transcriptional regulator n=1 Tax=Alteribacter lacisalsi TaxID=2045244 RepID=A0A2W0HX72_9BACI|nr:PucR family transcriptional regulator [Alteribacter lacisalsi]PYZ98348.1 hypothetical protein CR205_07050 [Alteribacter lacisalsi]